MKLFTQKVYDYVSSCLKSIKFNEGVKGVLEQIRGKNAKSASLKVSGNWRVTFRLEKGDVLDVNYEDYH